MEGRRINHKIRRRSGGFSQNGERDEDIKTTSTVEDFDDRRRTIGIGEALQTPEQHPS